MITEVTAPYVNDPPTPAARSSVKSRQNPKYRQEAARPVIDAGRTIAEVARQIGVGEQLLGRWVAIERSEDDPPEAVDADERAELERLRREVAGLRMDREFLKRAAAFFATETSSPGGRSR